MKPKIKKVAFEDEDGQELEIFIPPENMDYVIFSVEGNEFAVKSTEAAMFIDNLRGVLIDLGFLE